MVIAVIERRSEGIHGGRWEPPVPTFADSFWESRCCSPGWGGVGGAVLGGVVTGSFAASRD